MSCHSSFTTFTYTSTFLLTPGNRAKSLPPEFIISRKIGDALNPPCNWACQIVLIKRKLKSICQIIICKAGFKIASIQNACDFHIKFENHIIKKEALLIWQNDILELIETVSRNTTKSVFYCFKNNFEQYKTNFSRIFTLMGIGLIWILILESKICLVCDIFLDFHIRSGMFHGWDWIQSVKL